MDTNASEAITTGEIAQFMVGGGTCGMAGESDRTAPILDIRYLYTKDRGDWPSAQLPEEHHVVIRGCSQESPVRRESHTINRASVPFHRGVQLGRFLSGIRHYQFKVPYLDLVICHTRATKAPPMTPHSQTMSPSGQSWVS